MDLPRLPGQYLAEVWAQLQLGQPEEGFEAAPGIMFLASRVRGPAAGTGRGVQGKGSRGRTGRGGRVWRQGVAAGREGAGVRADSVKGGLSGLAGMDVGVGVR